MNGKGGEKTMLNTMVTQKTVSHTKKTVTSKIEVTTDYDQFTFIVGNRIIDKTHISHIISSIKKKNLLHIQPIDVNERNEVVDGQHRLLAAKALHTPIYFIREPGLKYSDIILLASTISKWKPVDYLNTFIAEGKQDYIILKQFADKHFLSLSNAIAILSIGDKDRDLKAPMRSFKAGSWQITDLKVAEEFANNYRDIASFTEENTSKDRDLLRAVYRMYYRSEAPVSHADFMDQLKKYPEPIYRRLGPREYLIQFEQIYNFGKKGHQVRFF